MPIVRHLLVSEYGAFLGKHHGRLRVSRDGQVLVEAPLLHLEAVLILGAGVALSADAVEVCCADGIPIYFLDPAGRPYAALYSAGLTGTVRTRREQLLAYRDRRGVELAIAFARGKITNQANFLRYAAKYRERAAPEAARRLHQAAERVRGALEDLQGLQGDTVEEIREQILAIEGRAAQRYWEALGAVIPESYGWPGRIPRGAQDPINAALNYGYGILYGQVERSLVLAGLDPYGGFIHADRPGKPSLVLDLIEEFRAVVVDRTVVGMATKGMKLEVDGEGRLTEEARRSVAEKILERLDAAERYEGKRQPLRVILQSQARHIATFLRGERAIYEPFIARW
ncbi:CRISPR-associated endonuclease Cas1 [Thermoflexus hugenholtzii]